MIWNIYIYIWPKDGTLIATNVPGQSELASIGKEELLHNPEWSRTGAVSTDAAMCHTQDTFCREHWELPIPLAGDKLILALMKEYALYWKKRGHETFEKKAKMDNLSHKNYVRNFGLVSPFNDIATFVVYLMPKQYL